MVMDSKISFASDDLYVTQDPHVIVQEIVIPASWSRGNAFISGAGSLRLKSRAGLIRHSVANGSPLLRHFFEWSCVARAQ